MEHFIFWNCIGESYFFIFILKWKYLLQFLFLDLSLHMLFFGRLSYAVG